jgi:phosphoadenosine phosphosulfate reductase
VPEANAFAPEPSERDWTARWLGALRHRLAGAPPEEVLRWAADTFAPNLCLATSFGPQSIVLMHVLARVRPDTTIFYLDTDLLFDETHALIRELEARLGLGFVRVAPALSVEQQAQVHGPALWSRDPDRCCYLRKVLPLRRFLTDKEAWITGVRRGAAGFRATAELVEWDGANGLVKINPLVHWSRERVDEYIERHDLPVNALHARGYPSVGCRPCTRPVGPGEDPRAGRWPGREKKECGIHTGLRVIDSASDSGSGP